MESLDVMTNLDMLTSVNIRLSDLIETTVPDILISSGRNTISLISFTIPNIPELLSASIDVDCAHVIELNNTIIKLISILRLIIFSSVYSKTSKDIFAINLLNPFFGSFAFFL
jgi:hypothetical protein